MDGTSVVGVRLNLPALRRMRVECPATSVTRWEKAQAHLTKLGLNPAQIDRLSSLHPRAKEQLLAFGEEIEALAPNEQPTFNAALEQILSNLKQHYSAFNDGAILMMRLCGFTMSDILTLSQVLTKPHRNIGFANKTLIGTLDVAKREKHPPKKAIQEYIAALDLQYDQISLVYMLLVPFDWDKIDASFS